MTPVDDRIERLRDDLHGVDTRLVRVETELRLHREQSAQQHDDIMAAIADLRRDVTPRPPPSLPPGPALSTMPADHDPSSDPGAVTISPWPGSSRIAARSGTRSRTSASVPSTAR